MRIKWYQKDIEKHVRRVVNERLAESGLMLRERIRMTLDEFRTEGAGPSDPGEAPHRESGRLSNSMQTEPDPGKLSVRVGSNQPHALYMELSMPPPSSTPMVPVHAAALMLVLDRDIPPDAVRIWVRRRKRMAYVIWRAQSYVGKRGPFKGNLPRPFLRPALYLHRGEIQRIFNRP